ncbi:uncharacterized protein N7446_000100 [Penicillium canescens]|uniref:4a-hydroxytetrahydrobiopterin dehydratase n=1 Tax=Penicillium canescens TaxID=5083 RepID=A0AAD6I4U8_PENCN|nr:uncharacterized protein N7446_000100 [Penicillium canescens]KAJ6030833.1 hypothetical protein N7460_011099 [Penicillium canescens]KAJ6059449.1 hypothetical protein N7444_003088 [Penicillium canescens]KAJ6077164.1 hypothetical protein N7446_000100 [Penicillium canescens]
MSLRSTLRLCRPSTIRPLQSVTPRLRLQAVPRMASTLQFAEGEDRQQLTRDAEALLQQGWALDGEGMGITKTFHFKSYFKAVSFVNLIAAESASKKHHPTMTVRIGSVDVHWTTHRPRGFTSKDVALARHCEQGAGLMAVDPSQGLNCAKGK